MDKSLSERIAARAAKSSSHRNQNRATFLSLRPEIQQALSEGWSVRSIWETLSKEGKITFCYSSFCDYTNRLILRKASAQPPEKMVDKPAGASEPAKTAQVAANAKASPQIGGFTFNPSPKKEDLI